MKKIKAFFYVFKNSFDPKYYKDVLKAPFGFSLKYYFFYFLIFGLCTSVYMSFKYFAPFSKSLESLPDKIVNSYPDDLVLEMKNGNLISNYTEPLIIPMNFISEFIKDFDKNLTSYKKFDNFLVIDTNAEVDDFNDYKTLILLTEDNLISFGEDNNYQVAPFKNNGNNATDFVFNKNLIKNNIEGLRTLINKIPWFLGLGTLWVMIGILPVVHMFYLVFYALTMMLISNLNGNKLNFLKSFQVGLHLKTLWMTILAFVFLIEWRFRMPFVQTLFMIFYSILILRELRNDKERKIKN